MWTRAWLVAGLARDAAQPREWFTFDLGRESVLVARDAAGTLRAFYNVCQHRGARLCAGRAGCGDAFRCPYHGWKWGLDGRLAPVIDAGDFDPELLDDLRLAEIPCAVRAGAVWINLDSGAGPLDDWLGPIGPALDAYGLDDWGLRRDSTVEMAAN